MNVSNHIDDAIHPLPRFSAPVMQDLELTKRGLRLAVGEQNGFDPAIEATFMYLVPPHLAREWAGEKEAAFVQLISDFAEGARKLLDLPSYGDSK